MAMANPEKKGKMAKLVSKTQFSLRGGAATQQEISLAACATRSGLEPPHMSSSPSVSLIPIWTHFNIIHRKLKQARREE